MKIKIWAGIAISALFVWLAFRNVEYDLLWTAIRGADYLYLVPAVIITMFQFFLRSTRWGYLMEPVKAVGAYSLFSATVIGFMANNILPARIGEFVKAYAIGKKENIGVSASFATIVVERILDVVMIVALMLLALFLVDIPPEMAEAGQTLKKGAAAVVILFSIFLALLLSFKNNTDTFKSFCKRLIEPVSFAMAAKLADSLDSFASGLAVLEKGRHLIPILFLSLAIWLVSAVPIHFVLISFGYALPFSISIFILVITSFAVAIPSAPGFIGTFHYACAVGLGFFGIPDEKALSVAIILHAVNFFPVTLVGFFFLWKDKISLPGMERVEEDIEETAS